MRHGRAKQARKTLQFFQRTIGLRPPYHVMLDGTFVVAFMQHKLPLQERLERLLHVQHQTDGPSRSLIFVTTESVIQEIATIIEQSKDAEKKAVLEEARDWMATNCTKRISNAPSVSLEKWASVQRNRTNANSALEDLSAAGRDLLSVLMDCNGIVVDAESDSNDKVAPPLLLASQDESLLHLGRQSGKAPVIRLARGSVLLLEQPSHVAQHAEQQAERNKWTVRGSLPEQEKILVDLVKQKERQQAKRSAPSGASFGGTDPRRKRKAKGPNPLSVKKKKVETKKTKST